jgi:hypothetical protein
MSAWEDRIVVMNLLDLTCMEISRELAGQPYATLALI